VAEEPVPAPVEAAPALPERPDAPPPAARPDRAPDEGADAGPLALPQASPAPARVLAIGGPDAAAPALGRPDAYAPPAGGPDAAPQPAPATARAERPDPAPPTRLDALLGSRAGDPMGPAGAPTRAAGGTDLTQRLASLTGARGDEGTRVTALGEAALLDVSLPGGPGQSAGASLLQFLAGYLIPPGASHHLMLVVELALLGLLGALVLPRGLVLRLLARAGAVHAGYRAVALRPG
jgi:hypothetical protein